MLRDLILWKVTKVTFLTAFILSFIVFLLQIFHFSFVLFGLPLTSSLPFFVVWFSYYTYFFLVDGLIVGTALILYELKEKKILHVIYSFHRSPAYLLRIFSFPAVMVFVTLVLFSSLLLEEKVSLVRRVLALEYKDKIFSNIPERTFLGTRDVVLYTERREKNVLINVFLKYKDTEIVAEKAIYRGKGRFEFHRGTVITKEKGKYLFVEFDSYILDTEEEAYARLREKRIRRDLAINLANTVSLPFFFMASFFLVLRFCRTHFQTNYTVAILVILHQLILLSVKISL